METYTVSRDDVRLGEIWHDRDDDGQSTWGYSDGFDEAARLHIERVIDEEDAFDRQAGALRTEEPNPLVSRSDAGWFGLLIVPALRREGFDLDEVDPVRHAE